MTFGNRYAGFGGALALCVFFSAASASAGTTGREEENLPGGAWLVEFSGAADFNTTSDTDRNGDFYFLGSIEYASPVHPKIAIGWRSYPLFLYHQEKIRDSIEQDESIYGFGTGIAFRFFLEEGFQGHYGEIGGAGMWHTDQFHGNGSRFDFLSEVGWGYRFENNTWVAIKYHHISNAGLDGANSGVNAVVLSAGFSF